MTTMFKKAVWATTLVTAVAFASQANALILKLDDGANGTYEVDITDQGVGDSNATLGIVSFSGPIGSWVVNVTTGLSKPVLGAGNDADKSTILDLVSVNVSGGTGSLTIVLEDEDYTSGSTAHFLFNIGGTTDGTVTASAFLDNSSTANNLGSAWANDTYSGGAFSSSTDSGDQSLSALYGQAISVTIAHTGFGVSSFDAAILMPEPAALGLFGLGLIGLGLAARRRRTR